MRGRYWIKHIEFKSDFGSQVKTIGKNLETCLKEWRIKKVCCVTIDNASVNSVTFTYLIREMSDIEKKNNSMKYIEKKPIKVSEPNWLVWFGFIFEKHQKPNQLRVHWFGYWIHQKFIQTGPITPLNMGVATLRIHAHCINEQWAPWIHFLHWDAC
jgi:hypothetical protein